MNCINFYKNTRVRSCVQDAHSKQIHVVGLRTLRGYFRVTGRKSRILYEVKGSSSLKGNY